MRNSVDVQGLNLWFGQSQVLENVDFKAKGAGITAIVGRSGSGKTSLLRQLNLLNEIFPGYRASGSVKLDFGEGPLEIMEAAPPRLSQLRRRVGMVFQTPDVLPVSIRRNLSLPLKVVAGLSRPLIRERTESALKMAGLWEEVKERLDMSAEKLSGGQKQRLCLARALALEPAILLLDEPTASLDVLATAGIEELLARLALKLPLVMVTHNPEQALRLAQNVAIMANGHIVRQIDTASMEAELLSSLL